MMAFSSFSEFVNMGGHGLYVWLAYGVGAIVLLCNLVLPKLHSTAIKRKLSQQFKRESL